MTPFAFAFLVIYGGLSDLSRFRIPNWVSYGLILLFAAHTFLRWLDTPFLPSLGFSLPAYAYNILIALVVFVGSTIFWKLGYVGGGDVKYLTATSLWMGPGLALPFIILLTGIAVGFAVGLKLLDRWSILVHWARLPVFAKRLFERLRVNELPYGFPICIAALIMIPQIFRPG
jgi:prepilin peptidase CpaA